ncbi:YqeG family HAD IIIA-type phosphatase [Oscillatoria sp. CS-180]|uniref:YqeG family HAD IIIA-type phosphatase n=1 Tax=Oscillatoria sp. CS-180 TaxID=3021720 RepID=UPI00232E7BAE|nr:YqeG family HAD IIIA-type phosphatase [Oscillatoria sp. CS-180]MDB9528618.1 YqeG family HAD IIIA-type phosphatase [Oscillatoria sp. CS-180]
MCNHKLQPDLVLGEPVLGITPEIIHRYRLRGLILDVDETLVPFREIETTSEVIAWFNTLREQVPIWLVSNNMNESRIRRIAESLKAPYIIAAGKPSRRKLRQAAEAMKLPVEQVAMVGDRLFTDVLAGNRLGMFTILVEPMVYPMGKPGKYLLRSVEVWISQVLGVSLHSAQ